MAPKGGTFFFLLIVACAVLAKPPYKRPGERDFKDMAKKLKIKMWNCTNLANMIRLMRNSSEASACYVRAFLAPVSWATLTTNSENNMDSDDYDTLLWAAKPALLDMPSSRMNLPSKAEGQNMKMMMKMLQEMFDPMSDNQRTRVAQWAKEQITQNYFNCTMKPPSHSRSTHLERCKASLKWLNLEAMTMMGPYLSRLAPPDVDSSPKEKVGGVQRRRRTKYHVQIHLEQGDQDDAQPGQEVPPESSGLLQLGTLACYYYDAPDLTPELSKKLLSQLDNCDNPRIRQLKKRLVKSVISKSNAAQALRELGSSVTMLSPKQLSMLSDTDLKEVLKNLGPNVQWTRGQMRALLKKQLGDKKVSLQGWQLVSHMISLSLGTYLSGEELMALQSVAEGLPSCVLKHMKARVILEDREALKNISRRMRKGQLKAMLEGLRGGVDPSELVQKLSGPLLRRISLSSLEKANITSLDQVENKTWSRPQAAYLAKKMQDLKQLQFRRLRSVLQGITCKMIDKVADNDTQNMAQAVAETPQWVPKVQAGCAARKLFATLEKERADYFKTITSEELDKIPAFLLPHLPPSKVKDLPDSVCPVFIDKMEMANLSSLPLRAPSRPVLTEKALNCLTKEVDFSKLTSEDVSRLGQLLCELTASQLRLMAPDVINSTLQAMASCQHIPQGHRADLIQLVNQTFGDPSDWSAETMEALGPILLLDDTATSALPNKPWMKDVLYFLKSRLSHVSDALRKKFFDLTTTTNTANAARRKREANSNGVASSNTGTNSDRTPTVEMIEELGMANVYWLAPELDRMSKDTFLATVEILGAIPDYSADQLDVLSKKAIEAFGPVSAMTESEVMQMGCITQGFSGADLEKLPFTLDAVEEIAHCGWNDSQMELVWRAVAKYNTLTAQQLGTTDMVTLNRFICGLTSGEIKQLDKDAFRDAVGSMDGIQCSFNVTQELKMLAMSVFGKPSTWNEAQVSDLGNIIAGLDANELASMDPSLFSFLSDTSIPLIPPNNFAALSVAQLEALGPDNAAMVTNKQRAALRVTQRAALDRALTGSLTRSHEPTKTSQSGAPSLSVEGISAYVKPLLFLLMGFLLL
ncbi:otoancorin [Seriola aureovittata]|uniref:otoancorin n=1 Tax=Seriola aureovittata TaxID=2871759 RepID=UPI0024BE155B|nr:otoancorin [Seriola aureovittata]